MFLSTKKSLQGGGYVGINAHLLSGEAGYRRAGIHQYIAQVLRHLPWEEGQPAYIVFTRHEAAWLNRPGMQVVTSRLPTENRLVRIFWEQVVWPWLVVQKRPNLLHSMAFVLPFLSQCPAVVTVYDLSFMHFPASFPAVQRLYLTQQTRYACRKARRVITISESGRQDVHRFFQVPLANIQVVYPGVDAVFRPFPASQLTNFRQAKNLTTPFILHVGTLQPRKNLITLIEAFAQADLPNCQLVLVGGKGWLFEEIFARVQLLGLVDRVRFVGYVPDEELPYWYNTAELLVFPSLYEGFGMPVIEAMACGTPVIAANTSSLPEAVGEAALFFAPYDRQTLADHLTAVLQNPALAATLRTKGLQQAGQFSWLKAGRETAEIYQQLLTDREIGD